MEIQLLGTGAGPGWPQPWCDCASCHSAYAEGEIRAHTSAIVDGTLLLDCGHDVGRSAVRLGIRFDDVRHVLVTHDHFDHANGSLLLSRHWAGRAEPLDVWGPPAALAALEPWLPPSDPGVGFHPLLPGNEARLDGYRVLALAAEHDSDGALLYDVTAPDGHRLLYATDTGPAFETPTDARYDIVLLEESWGDRPDLATGRHHDLTSFPTTLARLRRLGAIDAATRVAAIHVGHGNPAPTVLRRRLAAWGADLPTDGAVIGAVGTRPTIRPRRGRTLVLGGARSGKSVTAEQLLAAEPTVTYIATAHNGDGDAEWSARIEAHRARRPRSWVTRETLDLSGLLRKSAPGGGTLLIDCLTLWLSRTMDDVGVWSARDENEAQTANARLRERIDDLLDAWAATDARVVAVSNEVGAGVVPEHTSGRRFRDELGALNARVADAADDVVLVVAGIPQAIKGCV